MGLLNRQNRGLLGSSQSSSWLDQRRRQRESRGTDIASELHSEEPQDREESFMERRRRERAEQAAAEQLAQQEGEQDSDRSFGDVAKDFASEAKEGLLALPRSLKENFQSMVSTEPSEGPRGAELIEMQEQAKKRLEEFGDDTKKRVEDKRIGPSYDRALIQELATGEIENEEQLNKRLDELEEQKRQDDLETLGAVAEGASYGIGGGAVTSAFRARGWVGVGKSLLGSGAAGGIGTAGYTLREDPEAGGREILESAAMGTAAGIVLPVLGKGLVSGTKGVGKGVAKGARYVGADTAIIKSGKMTRGAFNKMDELVRSAAVTTFSPALRFAPVRATAEMFGQISQKFYRSDRYIAKTLQRAEREGKITEGTARTADVLMGNVKRAERSAESYMQSNDNWLNTIGNTNNRGRKKLAKYVEARAELDLIRQGVKKDGGRSAKFQKVVDEAPDEFNERFGSLVNYYRDLLERHVDEGIVSRKKADAWLARGDNYIHIQREIDNLSNLRPSGTGSGSASIRGTRADQKRGGSTAETRDLLATAIERTQQFEREIARNKAASAVIDALKQIDPSLAKAARTAENVLSRQSLQESLALSGPLKRQLERFTKTQRKYVRRIQSEVNKIQREARGEVEKGLRQATKGKVVKETDLGEVPAENIAAVIDEILSTNKTVLNRLNKKYMNREPKLAKAIQELQDMQSTLNGINAQRRLEYQEMLKRSDKKTKGLPKISRRVDGVDEVYTTIPEIEAAAKAWTQVPMGAVGRAMAWPVRAFRAAVTGPFSPVFWAKSLQRDGLESFVLSRNAMETHHPKNIVGSLADMAGKSDLFEQYWKTEGMSTFTDVLRKPRSAARMMREHSRTTKPSMKRKAEIVTTPQEWFRRWENVGRAQEHIGRFQNFRGMYNDAIKSGATREQALIEARWAARNNQVDFFQTGDWSTMANSMLPYFNPTVQGGARIAKAFKDKPVTTSAKVVTGLQIPAALSVMYNMSDPRRAEIYMDLRDYERENNFIFVMPESENEDNRWSVLKIPKPAGVGSLTNPVETMMLSLYGHDPVEFGEFVQATLGTGSPFDINSWTGFVGSAIPHNLKLAVEDAFNFDSFTGRPIVPDDLLDNEPEPFMQHYDDTSATARQLGKWLDISPLRVEHLIKNALGTGGRHATHALDTALVASGVADEEAVGGRSTSEEFQRSFASAQGGETTSRFYNIYNPTSTERRKVSREVTELVQQNRRQEAKRRAEEFNARIADRFRPFIQEHGQTEMYNEDWNEMINKLQIPTHDRAFNARDRQ